MNMTFNRSRFAEQSKGGWQQPLGVVLHVGETKIATVVIGVNQLKLSANQNTALH